MLEIMHSHILMKLLRCILSFPEEAGIELHETRLNTLCSRIFSFIRKKYCIIGYVLSVKHTSTCFYDVFIDVCTIHFFVYHLCFGAHLSDNPISFKVLLSPVSSPGGLYRLCFQF